MSLGDVYGKFNKSGNDVVGNTPTRSSEDGSDSAQLKKPSATALTLARKHREKETIEKQMIELSREILSADLRKKDTVSFQKIKKDLDSKIKILDQSKRRLDDEIRRLDMKDNIQARRHI